MPESRRAVSLLFFLNGFITGNWAPMIPEFAQRLGLSESGLGLMIVAFGIGSLIAMPVVGVLIARRGSHQILRALAAVTAFALLIVTLAPAIPFAAIAMLLLGAAIGGMDAAMNVNAVAVELSLRRAIMSSCHGFWSLGGLIGAAAGGYGISALGSLGHAVAATAAAAALVAFAWRGVMEDRSAHGLGIPKLALPRTLLPWAVGLMALCAFIPEGAVLDWGALYFRQELGADIAVSGLAFGAFSGAMALMRFAGDKVRDRFGAVTTIRVCAIIAIGGMLISGLAPSAGIAVAGLVFAGIGISNLVPIAFSAAGNLPGLAPGIGMSVATFMGYSGILFAPSFIGFIAERTGFAAIFTALPALFLVLLILSPLARHADRKQAG